MTDVLRTIHLTKSVNGKNIVSDINMHIKKGEIYGFLGPNGSGKTTIMKMLTTLTEPTSGEIELFGQKLTHNTQDVCKRMGSIIEYPIFYEHLTAYQNMKIHCDYLGFYDDNTIEQVFEMVNLKNIENKTVKHFSLGMKQRLGIARAIIIKPELVILDEPINGLDPVGIREIRDLIKLLNKEYGITFLISTHILGEIEQIADTIGVIKDGKMLNEVSIAEIQKQQTDYIELVTNDVTKAVYILEQELHLSNLKIQEENQIRIYDLSKSQSEISKTLVMNDINIEEIRRSSSSLEDYFFQQIHGGGAID